jgi:hypothetical protein
MGSSAAVKSPTVNPTGCFIGAASDMFVEYSLWPARWLIARPGIPYIVEPPQQAYGWLSSPFWQWV